jgi:hypothetical protein
VPCRTSVICGTARASVTRVFSLYVVQAARHADAAASLAGVSGVRPFEPRQAVISVIALCFFPFAHQATLLSPLGLDAQDPRFLTDRKAHITDLLRHGLTTSASGSAQQESP